MIHHLNPTTWYLPVPRLYQVGIRVPRGDGPLTKTMRTEQPDFYAYQGAFEGSLGGVLLLQSTD